MRNVVKLLLFWPLFLMGIFVMFIGMILIEIAELFEVTE